MIPPTSLNTAEHNRFVVELSHLGYEIEGMIGRGGMGTVFRARQRHLDRVVAVKAMSNTLIADPTARQRFEAEMRTMASLNHPSIVRVEYGQVTASGIPFFVMEYIEGQSLDRYLAGRGGVGVEVVVDKLAPVADALDFLHSAPKPIVHRDVKPANIMLTADGAKLTDFGISYISDDTRLTQEGSIVGTDAYMAPELFDASPLTPNSSPQPTPASDNYALALIALEMLTGVSLRETMTREGWRGPRVLPSLSGVPGAAAFERALANDPRERHDTAGAFIRELAAGEVRRPRGRKLMAALTVAVLGVAGAGVWYETNARWSSAERVLVDAFPAILPSHSGTTGWRGATCVGAEPDADQKAKIVCHGEGLTGEGLTYVVADFGSAATRERYTPVDEWGDFDADGCRMRSGVLSGTASAHPDTAPDTSAGPDAGSDGGGEGVDKHPGETFVVVPSPPRDYAAVLLAGDEAEAARLSIPLCG